MRPLPVAVVVPFQGRKNVQRALERAQFFSERIEITGVKQAGGSKDFLDTAGLCATRAFLGVDGGAPAGIERQAEAMHRFLRQQGFEAELTGYRVDLVDPL